MKNTKTIRMIALLLACLIPLALLAGCGNPAKNSSDKDAESSADEKAETQAATGSAGETGAYSTKEIYCDHQDGKIYGIAYIPDGGDQHPLVILSHGLGGNNERVVPYAERLAENGYAAYVFDFPNGTSPAFVNKSGTETTKMSVMTEADALDSVINAAKSWDFADSSKLYLAGESQGGLVSTVVACRSKDSFKGLILLYPAFNIPEIAHETLGDDLSSVPEEFNLFGWITVGRIYAEDVWNMDIYSDIAEYDGRVLLIHGDSDTTVDISYSDRASETFKDCEYHVIEGAIHGFEGDSFETAMGYILGFMKNAEG